MSTGAAADEDVRPPPPPPPPEDEAEEGAPEWVVTFADLMSLLLCFFVLLLSFSQMNDERFKELAGSLKDAFGVQRETPAFDLPRGLDMVAREFNTSFLADVPERMRSTIRRLRGPAGSGASVEEEGRLIRIVLDGAVAFPAGEATLSPESRELLAALLPLIAEADGAIQIEGHTDSVPKVGWEQRFEDGNWELSYRRALAVLRLFVESGDIDVERLAPIGHGASKPVGSNLTPWGRAKNRRVEITILRKPPPAATADAEATPAVEPEETDVAIDGMVPEQLIPEARFSVTEQRGSRRAQGLFPD
jgi:chemotaxis protein MotB